MLALLFMNSKLITFLSIIVFSFFSTSCGNAVQSNKAMTPKNTIPVVYSPKYKISVFGLEKLHPFDIAKYDKIYAGLLKDGLVTKSTVVNPSEVTLEEMLLVHKVDYIEKLKSNKEVAGFLEAPQMKMIPNGMLDRMIVSRFRKASGGTIAAARLALKHPSKMAFNLGGGYHHAKPAKGEGFCIIADVPIAIKVLQKEGLIDRALIIDTDIHQGNGTIACLVNDPSTYTFSIHEGGIYPMPKEVGDQDVEVKAGITDDEYLTELKKHLDDLFRKSKPNIVFHVAGCDALAGDPLANGKMTHAGIVKRDQLILAACKKHKVPYVMTLSGGYSKDAWNAQYKSIKAILESERK